MKPASSDASDSRRSQVLDRKNLKATVPSKLIPRLDPTGHDYHVHIEGVSILELYATDGALVVQNETLSGCVEMHLQAEAGRSAAGGTLQVLVLFHTLSPRSSIFLTRSLDPLSST